MNIADIRELADHMAPAQVSLVEIEDGDLRLRLAMDHPTSHGAPVAVHRRASAPLETTCAIASASVAVFHRNHPARSAPEAADGQLIMCGAIVGFLEIGPLARGCLRSPVETHQEISHCIRNAGGIRHIVVRGGNVNLNHRYPK